MPVGGSGDQVALVGRNLVGVGLDVQFRGVPAPTACDSAEHWVATVPKLGAAGEVEVRVHTNGGESTALIFRYD